MFFFKKKLAIFSSSNYAPRFMKIGLKQETPRADYGSKNLPNDSFGPVFLLKKQSVYGIEKKKLSLNHKAHSLHSDCKINMNFLV